MSLQSCKSIQTTERTTFIASEIGTIYRYGEEMPSEKVRNDEDIIHSNPLYTKMMTRDSRKGITRAKRKKERKGKSDLTFSTSTAPYLLRRCDRRLTETKTEPEDRERRKKRQEKRRKGYKNESAPPPVMKSAGGEKLQKEGNLLWNLTHMGNRSEGGCEMR